MRGAPLLLACAIGLALAAHSAAGASQPDPRHEPLHAFETASVVALGVVQEVEGLPHAAFVATLRLDRVLGAPGPRPDGPIEVAWEEPAPSLPPRWAAGDRVLVALAPLPTASIWAMRVPDAARRARIGAIAGGGLGYLERPSPGSVLALEHYLALEAAERAGATGTLALARLGAHAPPRLSISALARLAGSDAGAWSADANAALIRTLLRGERGERGEAAVVDAGLQVVGAQRPPGLSEALSRAIAARAPDAPAPLYEAQARLAGGLDAEATRGLLASPSARRRAVAARWAGPEDASALRRALRLDRSPAVRAAAASRLVALDPEAALADVLRSFDDPAPEVRLAAARAVASMGAAAQAALLERVDAGPPESARTAIATLSLMDAGEALREIAEGHADPAIRALASVAIGRGIGHTH